MNVLEFYLIISTILLMFGGVCWYNNGATNKLIKTVFYLTSLVGGGIALTVLGLLSWIK